MKKTLTNLLTPEFIIGLVALVAVVGALFYFGHTNKELTLALVTVLTNVLTGVTTYYYTKHQNSKTDEDNKQDD